MGFGIRSYQDYRNASFLLTLGVQSNEGKQKLTLPPAIKPYKTPYNIQSPRPARISLNALD
jgi:hypothetical protein